MKGSRLRLATVYKVITQIGLPCDVRFFFNYYYYFLPQSNCYTPVHLPSWVDVEGRYHTCKYFFHHLKMNNARGNKERLVRVGYQLSLFISRREL